MLLKPPTVTELTGTFDAVLGAILAGARPACPTDTGLDAETVDALNAIGAAPNKPVAALVARKTFAHMLDGTHARAARARLQR